MNQSYNKFTKIADFARLDKKMALAFGILVMLLMLIILLVEGFNSKRILDNEEEELITLLTNVLSNSINRISFSGKYHARLLIEEISLQPRILYCMIIDQNNKVIAHSTPSFNDQILSDPTTQHTHPIFAGKKQVIQNLVINDQRLTEVALPYRTGYNQELTGIFRVGVSTQNTINSVYNAWLTIGILIFTLFIISIFIIYRMSAYFAQPIRKLAMEFQSILDHTPLLIAIYNPKDGHIIEASQAFYNAFFSTSPSPENNNMYQALTDTNTALIQTNFLPFSGNKITNHDFELHDHHSTRFFSLIQFSMAMNQICFMAQEITQRKIIELKIKQINHLREDLLALGDLQKKLEQVTNSIVTIFNATFCGIWLIDPQNTTIETSTHHLKLITIDGDQQTLQQIAYSTPIELMLAQQFISNKQSKYLVNRLNKTTWYKSYPWINEQNLTSFTGYQLLSDQQEPLGIIAIFSKNTIDNYDDNLLESVANSTAQVIQTMQSAIAIQSALEEKKILLKEIHHRTKNNMQIIISMLGIHEMTAIETKYQQVFKQLSIRIHAMALIHDKLYSTDNLLYIDFNTYVEELVHYILTSYQPNCSHINLHFSITDFAMDIDHAINCGLVISELILNALKHAFPNHQEGSIEVILQKYNQQTVELIIRDNGIGMPKDFDYHHTSGIGLQLIHSIIEKQLAGKLTYTNNANGTSVQIRFPIIDNPNINGTSP